jgi:hypothetical protein
VNSIFPFIVAITFNVNHYLQMPQIVLLSLNEQKKYIIYDRRFRPTTLSMARWDVSRTVIGRKLLVCLAPRMSDFYRLIFAFWERRQDMGIHCEKLGAT